MKKIFAVLLAFTLAVSLTACGSGSSKIVGRWERQKTEEISAPFNELEFFSDNTYSSDASNYNGNYSVDGNRIKLDGILVEPITCSFDVSGKTLILTRDDKTWEFTKAE